jgi:hypothetical protein
MTAGRRRPRICLVGRPAWPAEQGRRESPAASRMQGRPHGRCRTRCLAISEWRRRCRRALLRRDRGTELELRCGGIRVRRWSRTCRSWMTCSTTAQFPCPRRRSRGYGVCAGSTRSQHWGCARRSASGTASIIPTSSPPTWGSARRARAGSQPASPARPGEALVDLAGGPLVVYLLPGWGDTNPRILWETTARVALLAEAELADTALTTA